MDGLSGLLASGTRPLRLLWILLRMAATVVTDDNGRRRDKNRRNSDAGQLDSRPPALPRDGLLV